MKITDEQVASIRAYVTVDMPEFERLSNLLSPGDREARGTLISASLYLAAEKRFSGSDSRPDIILFVSSLRERSAEMADLIDPRAAERILLAVVADENIDDIDDSVKNSHFGPMLVGLIVEAGMNDAELDRFLEEARDLADSMLAG